MNVVNNVDMSCLRAPWQNGPYKNEHNERHKNAYNIMTQQTFRKTIFLCFSDFFLFFYFFIDNFLNKFSKEMLSYRLGTVNDFHWELKTKQILTF